MKKNYLRCLSALMLIMLSITAFAQKTVTGTVKESSGEILPGVSVSIKGTQKVTKTNVDGKFSISVTEGNVLQFKYIGFKSKEVTVGATTSNLMIVLESTTSDLDEVVVTALGVKREKRALAYSAQTVSGKDLTVAQAPTIAQGLMGKVAGLNISQASGGADGGSSRIVVRGNTSLTGDNRALIVVDGVPINNAPLNGVTVGTNLNENVATYKDWGTGLNFINSEDIENITVLKGSAAAALYGTRGANGVILVTRKKGGKQNGMGIDYSYNNRFSSVYDNYYNFQNEYGLGFAGSLATADNSKKFPVNGNGQRYQVQTYGPDQPGNYFAGAGGWLPYTTNPTQSYSLLSYPSGQSWGAKFDNQPILWYDGVLRPYSAQPNNWKALFPNGSTGQHNVSLSGGGEFGTMRLSYTRDDNDANILNSNSNNNIFNLGSSIKVSDKLTAEVAASYVNFTRLNTPNIGGDGPLMAFLYSTPRDFRPDVDLANQYNANGSRRDLYDQSNFPAGSPKYPYNGGYIANVYWNTYQKNEVFMHNNFTGSIKLNSNLTDWLTLTGQVGIDYGSDKTDSRDRPTNTQGTADGRYATAMAKTQSRDLLGLARFYKDNVADKELNVSFTAGVQSTSINNYRTNSNTKGNFLNPFLYYIGNGAGGADVNENLFAYKINSVLGTFDASYKNNWFLQVTGRNDWTSTLKNGYNSFFYPSASLGYVFSDGIKQLKETMPWLSFGKLSASYSSTGSGTNPYATNSIIDGNNYNGVVSQSYQNVLSDPKIKPQRTHQYEAILNLGFLKNRLNLELTGYVGNAAPQIVTTALPSSSGVSNIRINDAKLANKGFEFIINATPIATKNFTWNVSVNGAHSTNKIVSLSGADSVLTIGNFYDNQVLQKVKVGDNYGTIYGKDFTYLNGQRVVKYARGDNGQPLSYTANGTTYNVTSWALTATDVPIGNSQPFLVGGISNTFRYKDFSLFVLTDAKLGGDTYFGSYGAGMGNGLRQETVKERNGGGLPLVYPDGTSSNTGMIMEGVFADGTKNSVVVSAPWYYASTYGSWNHIGLPRSEAVFNNSWMKLREVNLTYQIPQSFVQKSKVFQRMSLSLVGRDLFYIFTTIPKGLNPEGVNGIGNVQGIEFSSMPNTRSFGFSVRASF